MSKCVRWNEILTCEQEQESGVGRKESAVAEASIRRVRGAACLCIGKHAHVDEIRSASNDNMNMS